MHGTGLLVYMKGTTVQRNSSYYRSRRDGIDARGAE